MPNKYTSRTAYDRRFSQLLAQKMQAAERFIGASPAETPLTLRTPYAASEWVKLTEKERRDHVRERTKKEIADLLGPRPVKTGTRTLTLSALEALTIERANNHADDLRCILNGTPDQVEAIISAQLPALRGKVFDKLTSRYSIIEG